MSSQTAHRVFEACEQRRHLTCPYVREGNYLRAVCSCECHGHACNDDGSVCDECEAEVDAMVAALETESSDSVH